MTAEMVNAVLGLLVGLVTGFFFEHRSKRALQHQNEELEQELELLRHSVYSMGGSMQRPPSAPPSEDLAQRVYRRAVDTQDSRGRVSIPGLIVHFTASGVPSSEVEDVIATLCQERRCRRTGNVLEMK
ncbi:MAG TPA: hypothetical protein VFF24_17040 [Acidimicrobiia bacterium]|nr:hypothetical protein [Acidimicrobiia bacterium]